MTKTAPTKRKAEEIANSEDEEEFAFDEDNGSSDEEAFDRAAQIFDGA